MGYFIITGILAGSSAVVLKSVIAEGTIVATGLIITVAVCLLGLGVREVVRAEIARQ